jgi:hypothetical protein
MTNNHLTPLHDEVTPSAEPQRAARSHPSVRRLALIGTDGSRFRVVAAPAHSHPGARDARHNDRDRSAHDASRRLAGRWGHQRREMQR